MRMFLQIAVLILMFSCQEGISTRDVDGFSIDQAEKVNQVNHCEDQTSPSPICPSMENEENPKPTPKPEPTTTEEGEAGDTDTSLAEDNSPVYIKPRTGLEMRLKPWPHRIKKNKKSELTLTFTASHDLRNRGTGNNGQRTYDVHVGAWPREGISVYFAKSLVVDDHAKATTSFSHGNDSNMPSCSTNIEVTHSCNLRIVKMSKGDSFTLKLTVKSAVDFSITSLTLDGERPQVKVVD